MKNKDGEKYKTGVSINPAYQMASEKSVKELDKVPFLSDEDKKVLEHYLYTWAPVLIEYTSWVLKDAKKRGIKKLYFLSRDAYPMYMIAVRINTEDIELHYLRVSRYCLRIPEMLLKKDDFLDFLFLSGIDVTIRKIWIRGALLEEEISKASKIIGYDGRIDEILSRPEILMWKKKAQQHKDELWDLVRNHAELQMPYVSGYLRQEGLFDDEHKAVVDSGWVGTIQQSLLSLMRYEKPDLELEGYYFGLYEIPHNADPASYHTYYFEPGKDIRKKVLFSNCLFEAVSSEPAGMTVGYRFNDGSFEALLAEGGSLNDKFLQKTNAALEIYAEAFCVFADEDNGESVAGHILPRLMAYPDKWEAEVYGRLYFCDDVLENGRQNIAYDLTYKDICNLRIIRKSYLWFMSRAGRKTDTIHESGWIYGSIVNCGKNVRWSSFCARFYQWVMYVRKAVGK